MLLCFRFVWPVHWSKYEARVMWPLAFTQILHEQLIKLFLFSIWYFWDNVPKAPALSIYLKMLDEKYPNSKFFLALNFLYSTWIWRYKSYPKELSVKLILLCCTLSMHLIIIGKEAQWHETSFNVIFWDMTSITDDENCLYW